MNIKIEKNVKIPRGTRGTKWPFVHMEVGDSGHFPNEKVNGRAYRAAMSCGDRHGKKFVVRRDGDGIRVWRQL